MSTPSTKTTPMGPLRPSTQQEALQVLVHAIEIAQSRGAFNLFEAAEIVTALELFKRKVEDKSR